MSGLDGLHAVHLAPGHVPLDSRVYWKEAATLRAHGARVTIIASGRSVTTEDGVSVVGLGTTRSRLERFLRDPFRLAWRAWIADGDVYHAHDIEAIPVALLMGLRGRRVILDFHEDYPLLVADRSWLPARLRPAIARLVRAFEALAARRADAVISAEDAGAQRFPQGTTTVVRNYALDDEVAALEPATRDGRLRRVLYVGTMTRERGVLDLLGAAPDSIEEVPVETVLVGDLGELRHEIGRMDGPERLRTPGFSSRDAVCEELRRADVGVLMWRPTRKHAEGAVPVKLFEYMAAGLPVVVSDLPLLRAVVEDAGCGVVVPSGDRIALHEALRRVLSDPSTAREMGARGRARVLERYLWSHEAPALLHVYESVGASPRGRRARRAAAARRRSVEASGARRRRSAV